MVATKFNIQEKVFLNEEHSLTETQYNTNSQSTVNGKLPASCGVMTPGCGTVSCGITTPGSVVAATGGAN